MSESQFKKNVVVADALKVVFTNSDAVDKWQNGECLGMHIHGNTLVLGSHDNTIALYNLETGEHRETRSLDLQIEGILGFGEFVVVYGWKRLDLSDPNKIPKPNQQIDPENHSAKKLYNCPAILVHRISDGKSNDHIYDDRILGAFNMDGLLVVGFETIIDDEPVFLLSTMDIGDEGTIGKKFNSHHLFDGHPPIHRMIQIQNYLALLTEENEFILLKGA